MREHLDLGDGANGELATADALLLDPDRAAQTVRRRAAELDAWHDGGCHGPRPPGRLRRHDLSPTGGKPAAWTRWLTTPAYRAFLDPDGRPLGMRLRRSY
jgi:hypothetical protein